MSLINDIHERAQDYGGSHGLANFEIAAYNRYEQHPEWKARVPAEYNVQNKHRKMFRQLPKNGFNKSAFFDKGQVEFALDKNNISTVSHAYIQVKVTNDTGAAVTLAPTPFWIDRIELVCGNVLTTITGQQLFLSLAFLNREEFEQLAAPMCLTTNYATTGTSLASTASGVYYIPLLHLFSAAKLHLDGLNSEISVRVFNQASTYTILAGSQPTVTECALVVKGFSETTKAKAIRRAAYHDLKLPLKLPFINWITHKEIPTLAPSANYSFTLSPIIGTVPGMFITFRAGTLTGANQGNYLPIASLDIQTSGSVSIPGTIMTPDEMKLDNAEIFSNLFGNNKDWYFISFTSDPSGDYASGNVHGYQAFTGKEKLVFNTTSTLAAGSYQIDIHCLSAEHLDVIRGVITPSK